MHGIVIGRFQPVHKGHVQLIRQAVEDCVNVTVVVGSSEAKQGPRNPFSLAERMEMLEAACPGVRFVAVPDIHDPPNYPAHVASLVGDFDRVFGNDEGTLDLFEMAGYKATSPGLMEREKLEGKTIRAWMAEGDSAWRNAVPAPVAAILDRIEGSKRLARMD